MPLQSQQTTTYSVELFPPKTPEGMEKLKREIAEINSVSPGYFSVTYGAGGSTRDRTFETVDWLRGHHIETAPHIACVGSARAEISEILGRYREQGIRRLVALRGDLPSGMGGGTGGDFRYANELVTFIRDAFGDTFKIEVAAYPEYHPQSGSPERDLANFKRKVEAGANGAITQYFFNPDAYFRFVDDARRAGIAVPITPGIMPITQYSQLKRFSDMCGAEIPRWIAKRLEAYRDDADSIREFGADVVAQLCEKLIAGGVPGIHFYTLNRAKATLAVCTRIGIG